MARSGPSPTVLVDPQLRSVHRYLGTAFPELTGSRVVVVLAHDPDEVREGDTPVPEFDVLAVYRVRPDGEQLSEFAYAVPREHLEPLGETWGGTLPFPRVVLHARGGGVS